MTIIHPLNPFLYTLFPDIEKNETSLKKALIEFYSVGAILPVVAFNTDFVTITLNTVQIATEKKKFEKLIALCETANFEEANQLAKNLLKTNPNNSEYHRIQGQIYAELNQQEEAINSLIDALRWNPKNEWALLMMGNIIAKYRNDIPTAMKYYDQVLLLKPNDCITLNNIGANLMQLNKKEEALLYFNNALAANSAYPDTYYHLALVANTAKDYKKAFDFSLMALEQTNKQTNNFMQALYN